MTVDRNRIGRVVRGPRAYAVEAEKVREFADAIGDVAACYRDPAAAAALGSSAVLAPPTFTTIIDHLPGGPLELDGLGLDRSRTVHGEQRLVFERSMRVGDLITTETTVTGVRAAAGNELVTVVTTYRDAEGQLVCTSYSTIVSRGTAQPSPDGTP